MLVFTVHFSTWQLKHGTLCFASPPQTENSRKSRSYTIPSRRLSTCTAQSGFCQVALIVIVIELFVEQSTTLLQRRGLFSNQYEMQVYVTIKLQFVWGTLAAACCSARVACCSSSLAPFQSASCVKIMKNIIFRNNAWKMSVKHTAFSRHKPFL